MIVSNILKRVTKYKKICALPIRGIKLHEYQAAKLLSTYGAPVPFGNIAFSPDEAYTAAVNIKEKKGTGSVVKAQILGGGRGRGFFKENNFQKGVHLVKTPEEAKEVAGKMIGKSLVTKQSGPEGMKCGSVYLVETLKIQKEIYLAFTLDRVESAPVLVYSPEGGMAIEDVAEKTPEKIFKTHIDIDNGFTEEQIDEICKNLDLKEYRESAGKVLKSLFKCFHERDSDMIEINPMVVDKNAGILCADSKITIDDNAAFRQKEMNDIEDKSGLSKNEKIAEENHLSYIPIGGNIGCLVNGAGLAMATMDILKFYGGNPANFLDVGGGAVGPQMVTAINLLCDDPKVDTIYINIFGGILRCDLLVEAILKANDTHHFSKPIIMRLNGNKSEEAKKMIMGKEKDLGIHFEGDFDKSAQLAVKITKNLEKSKAK